MKEGIIFLIKKHSSRYHEVPACTSRCTSCWSQFISCGKYQRNVQRETPSEIPSSSIAQTMEAATAAVPTIDVDENENADTATVAEPEMEVDAPPSEAEQEPDEEMFNEVPDLEEEENAAPDEERRPLILPIRTLITDPDLMQARSAMQPSYYRYFPEKRIGRCNDAMRTAFAYMAYCLVRTMYKVWPTTSSWMTVPYFQMQEKFEQGCRYDVLGIVLASSVNLIVKARSAGTSQTKKFLSLRGQKQVLMIQMERIC